MLRKNGFEALLKDVAEQLKKLRHAEAKRKRLRERRKAN